MSDFTAKVGNDRDYKEVMGKQGLGVVNENGETFANLCKTSSLVIGVTIFAHRNIHLATLQKTRSTIYVYREGSEGL